MKIPSLTFSLVCFLSILTFIFSSPCPLLAQQPVDPWSGEEEDYLDEEELIDEEEGDLRDEEEAVEEPFIEGQEEAVPPLGETPLDQQPVVPPKKKKPAPSGEISLTPPVESRLQITRPPAQPPAPPPIAPVRPTPASSQPPAALPQLRPEEPEEKEEEIESEPQPPLFPTDEILLEAVEEEDDEVDLFQSDVGRELEQKRIAKLPPLEEELKEEPVPAPVPAKVIPSEEERKEIVREEAPIKKEVVELKEGVRQRGDKIVEIYEPYRIESPQQFSFQFKFAPYYPSKFEGADGHFQGIFDGGTGAWNEISLEWQALDLFGILGIKGGAGYYILVSHDRIDEKNLVFMNFIPVQGALAYHLAYWHNQWVVPFGEVGGGLYYIFQKFARPPSKGINYEAWKSGYYWGGGVQLLLDIFESDTARVFDVDYGVNNSYLTLEYRRIEAREKKEFDFSGEFFMIGLHFDF